MKILSSRHILEGCFMESAAQAEAALSDLIDAPIVAPNVARREYVLKRNRIARFVRRLLGGVQPDVLYDAGRESFLFLMGLRHEFQRLLDDPARRKWVYVFDAWEPEWDHMVATMSEWRDIGCVWFSSRQAAEYFQEALDFPVAWLPQAADSAEFLAADMPAWEEREAVVFNIGRNNPTLKRFFEGFCARHGYRYYGFEPDDPDIPFPDREQFVAQMLRSRIVVVHPRNLAEPEKTGDVSMLTARYFEAYNSGAVVCGYKPQSGEFEDVLRGFPFVSHDSDGDFEEELLREIESPRPWLDAMSRIREEHTWRRRLEKILPVLAGATDTPEGREDD